MIIHFLISNKLSIVFVSLSVKSDILIEKQKRAKDEHSVEHIEESIIEVGVDGEAWEPICQIGH